MCYIIRHNNREGCSPQTPHHDFGLDGVDGVGLRVVGVGHLVALQARTALAAALHLALLLELLLGPRRPVLPQRCKVGALQGLQLQHGILQLK